MASAAAPSLPGRARKRAKMTSCMSLLLSSPRPALASRGERVMAEERAAGGLQAEVLDAGNRLRRTRRRSISLRDRVGDEGHEHVGVLADREARVRVPSSLGHEATEKRPSSRV